MARIRSIKIDLFLDDGLESVSLEAHFLLAGLPVLADRAGRLEDKPKRIHAQIFPYRPTVDTAALLVELEDTGHIRRYEAGGQRYIEVCGWDRDQRPHVNEPKSSIPPPPPNCAEHCHSNARGIHELNPGIQAHKDRAGIRDSGLGILDLGCGDLPGIAPAQPAPEPKAAKRAKDAKPPDSRHAPLVKALTDAGWPFDGGKDAACVKALLALADQQEATRGELAGMEVLRRARIAWEQFPGFHSARTLSGLRSKWGEFATPDTGRGTGPPRATDRLEPKPAVCCDGCGGKGEAASVGDPGVWLCYATCLAQWQLARLPYTHAQDWARRRRDNAA